MNKLTKENFWNALYEKHPDEVKKFCNWIDEYKNKVGWDKLFNAVSMDDRELFDWNQEAVEIKAPKYHDLPIALQWGIFQQFCAENHPSGFGGMESTFEHPADMEAIPKLIEQYFANMYLHKPAPREEHSFVPPEL